MSQSAPDEAQLKERATKAMDKDDKKKMGQEKYNQFKHIKKVLSRKNQESKHMALLIEQAMDGKTPSANNSA